MVIATRKSALGVSAKHAAVTIVRKRTRMLRPRSTGAGGETGAGGTGTGASGAGIA